MSDRLFVAVDPQTGRRYQRLSRDRFYVACIVTSQTADRSRRETVAWTAKPGRVARVNEIVVPARLVTCPIEEAQCAVERAEQHLEELQRRAAFAAKKAEEAKAPGWKPTEYDRLEHRVEYATRTAANVEGARKSLERARTRVRRLVGRAA